MYSKHILTLNKRHSQHDNTTAFNINLQRSLLFKYTKTKDITPAEHSIVPFERAMAELIHAREFNGQMQAKFTTDQKISLGYQLAQATSRTKKGRKKSS
jgi:hypothetical protein